MLCLLIKRGTHLPCFVDGWKMCWWKHGGDLRHMDLHNDEGTDTHSPAISPGLRAEEVADRMFA